MIDSINSETNKVGETFIATLDEPLMQEVGSRTRGADVRGRIANINEAGRIAGSAQLGLELTQIVVNGIQYSLQTSEYAEKADGRGEQTAKRVGAVRPLARSSGQSLVERKALPSAAVWAPAQVPLFR